MTANRAYTIPDFGPDDLLTSAKIGDRKVKVQLGDGLTLDAWRRQKVVQDHSLLHGMFVNGVPRSVWNETINGVETLGAYVNASSASGKLVLNAGATLNDETVLDTYRTGRYEPNRGIIYSDSVFLPAPTAAGVRDFGAFTEENGFFFRRKADGLYACRQTTINGNPSPTVTEELIDLSIIPNYDPTKGNIYDIQGQWRGVGGYTFWIGDPDVGYSVCVHKFDILGTLDELSISNPTLPLAFRCVNLGDNVQLISGCADLSTEGGIDQNLLYGSISIDNPVGEIALPSGTNIPLLVVRNKKIVNSHRNVRGVQAFGFTAYADQNAFVRVWATRDETAITLNDQVWRDYGDGFLEFIQYDNPNVTTPMSFDTTKATLVFGSRVAANQPYPSSALFNGKAEIHQTVGDIFIFTLHHEKGNATLNGGITYEFGEEL